MLDGLNKAIDLVNDRLAGVGNETSEKWHTLLGLKHDLKKLVDKEMEDMAKAMCECGGHIGCCGTKGG